MLPSNFDYIEDALNQLRAKAADCEDVEELVDKLLIDLKNEFEEYDVIRGHCERVYHYFSNGRISDALTLPSEVISVAGEMYNKKIEEFKEWFIDSIIQGEMGNDQKFKTH